VPRGLYDTINKRLTRPLGPRHLCAMCGTPGVALKCFSFQLHSRWRTLGRSPSCNLRAARIKVVQGAARYSEGVCAVVGNT